MINTETLRALVDAGNRLDSAMDMQEQRERGTFHLSQQAAAGVWKDARRLWAEAVEQAISAGDGPVVFTNDGNEEQRFVEHESLSCPHCGGSGHRDDVAAAPVAPENSHGGRPMTLREVMEAEEGAAPAVEFVKEPLRNVPDGASFVEYMEQLAVGNLTAVDQIALDNLLYGRLKDAPAVEVDEAVQKDADRYRKLRSLRVNPYAVLPCGEALDSYVDALTAALGWEGGGNG